MNIKILLFILTVSMSLYAQDSSEIVKEMKDAQIERDFILSDNEFKECDTEEGKTEYDVKLKECVDKKVSELEEEQLNDFSNKYKLKTFNPQAAKSKNTLQSYLSERIQNALYGEKFKKDPKLKNMKYVDQKQFFELYKNQIGKNVLLEVSRYALENFATKHDPYNKDNPFLSVQMADKKVTGIFNKSLKKYFSSDFAEKFKCKSDEDTTPNCKKTSEITAFKEKQLSKAETNSAGPKILGDHFSAMSPYIGLACEYYRCSNIYTKTTDSKTLKNCADTYGVATFKDNIVIEDSTDYKQGQIACAVENRMKAYRSTIAKVDDMLAQFKDGKFASKTGFDLGIAFKGKFSAGQNGDKSLDEITAISSKELVENVDDLNKDKLSKKQEELQKKCFDAGVFNEKDKDCSILLSGSLSDEEIKKLETDEKLQTQIYLAQLDKLKERALKDKEELRSFLDKHGLSNKYPKLEDVDVNEVIELIKGKYASERLSIIENLKKKFERQTSNNADESAKISEFADKQLQNITSESDNIETLFNYSNIASSYLSVTDDNDKTEDTQNTVMRSIESDGYKKYAKDDQTYDVFFEDMEGGAKESSGADVELEFIDGIIGNSND